MRRLPLLLLLAACEPPPDTDDTGGGGNDTDTDTDPVDTDDTDSGDTDDTDDTDPGGSAPVADAGPDLRARGGSRVTLDGSASVDPDGATLSWSWTQTAGPAVALDGADGPNPAFDAPDDHSDLAFALTIDDGVDGPATDEVAVHVTKAGEGVAGFTGNPWFRFDAGGVRGVEWQAPYAWVVTTGGLQVWDLSDPARPTLAGSAPMPQGSPWGSTRIGDRLYVTGEGGLSIFDASDPLAPALITHWPGPYGKLYYAAGGPDGTLWVTGSLTKDLIALDASAASDTSPPVELSVTDFSFTLGAPTVRGDRMWVTNSFRGLQLLDISDPTSPKTISTLPTGSASTQKYDDVVLAGDVAYVCWSSGMNYDIHAVDYADETKPVVTARFAPLAGGSAWQSLVVAGDTLYVPRLNYGVTAFDLGDPLAPVDLGNANPWGGSWQFGAAVGEQALLGGAGPNAGLLDRSAARSVAPDGLRTGLGQSRDVLAGTGWVAAATSTGLHLSDPDAALAPLSTVAGAPSGWLAADGDLLASAWQHQWGLVDVSDPLGPVAAGLLEDGAAGQPWAGPMAWLDGLLVGAHRGAAPFVLDASDPSAVVRVGAGAATAVDLDLDGETAWLVTTDKKLEAWDLADPSAPAPIGGWEDPELPLLEALVWEPGVLVARTADAVVVLDVTAPDAVAELGRLKLETGTGPFARQGDLLWMANGHAGTLTLDLSVPAAPRLRARRWWPAHVARVAADATRVYAIGDSRGGALMSAVPDPLAALDAPAEAPAGAVLDLTLTWSAPLSDVAALDCLAGGGACAISDVDRAARTAKVTWELPEEAGPHELAVRVADPMAFEIAHARLTTLP